LHRGRARFEIDLLVAEFDSSTAERRPNRRGVELGDKKGR
jgi:hypothetical protein